MGWKKGGGGGGEDVNLTYPFILLHVGRDVDYAGGPLRAVFGTELFQQDLCGLSIGRVLCDEMKTFGFRDFFGCLGDVEFVCHAGWWGEIESSSN